ncbi:unnamed protein product [Owenia fusiformis]|uniref:Uncharacterized protein n=1 Tax=Owenia fusiformis TaxID=6347 RepID=A0A8S4N2U6_OWEFU|nr:unnamed protein product [Owenia fusiformis]
MSENNADTLPPIKQKFVPKVWTHFKKSEGSLRKMAPQLKSRYQAYEEPPKEISDAQKEVKKRLRELKKKQTLANMPTPQDEIQEQDKHEKLIGQLKAAEARNRLRIMRLRYQANRAQEVNHLIACQPSALKAVRLQALVPPYQGKDGNGDNLDKLDRNRVESLLEDPQGLLTNRIS